MTVWALLERGIDILWYMCENWHHGDGCFPHVADRYTWYYNLLSTTPSTETSRDVHCITYNWTNSIRLLLRCNQTKDDGIDGQQLHQAFGQLDIPLGGVLVIHSVDFAQYLPFGDRPLYCIAPTGSLALLGHTMY